MASLEPLIYLVYFLNLLFPTQADPRVANHFQDSVKLEAFQVLQTKCNTCHATKKRRDIFTMENMDSLAAQIHTQVFLKRKMPKGKKDTLSPTELRRLKVWVDATLEDRQSK